MAEQTAFILLTNSALLSVPAVLGSEEAKLPGFFDDEQPASTAASTRQPQASSRRLPPPRLIDPPIRIFVPREPAHPGQRRTLTNLRPVRRSGEPGRLERTGEIPAGLVRGRVQLQGIGRLMAGSTKPFGIEDVVVVAKADRWRADRPG